MAVRRVAVVAVGGAVTGSGLVRPRRLVVRRRPRTCSSIRARGASLGQVQGEVPAAVAGGPGGDVDQVAAQGGAAGFGAGEAGQGIRRRAAGCS